MVASRPVFSALLLVVASVPRCGSSTRAPDAAPPARTIPASSVAPWRSPSAIAQTTSPARAVGVADESGGWRIVLGGRRAEVHGRSVRWGDGSFASPLIAAHHTQHGWYFVAADGAIARAATFTGALDPVGAFEPGFTAAPTSQGRAALVADGRLYTTAGDGPWVLAGSAPQGRAFVAASFSDPGEGAAVLDDGSLVATHDGARTFSRPVRAIGGVREALLFEGNARCAPRSGSWLVLEGDALGAETIHVIDPFAAGAVPPDEVQRAIAASLVQHDGRLARREDIEALVNGRSGEGWVLDAADATAAVVSRRDRTRVIGETQTDTSRRTSCRIVAVQAARRLEQCDSSEGWYLIAPARDGGYPPGIPRFRPHPSPESVRVSDDLSQAAWPGRCDGVADARRVCAGTPTGAPRELALPGDLVELVSLRASSLLARVRIAGRAQACVVDLARGTAVVRSWQPPSDSPLDTQADRVGWADDGTLSGFAGGAALGFVEDAPGAALRTVQLPLGTHALAFGDARHGLAVGDTLDTLHVTRDGGHTFEHVRVPAAMATMPLGDPLHRSEVRCDVAGCTVADIVHLDGYASSLEAVEPRVRADGAPRIGPAVHVGPSTRRPRACAPEPELPTPRAFGPLRVVCADPASARR